VKRNRILAVLGLVAFALLGGQAEAQDEVRYRAEVGGGAFFGDPEFSVPGVTGKVDTDTGIAISAGLWSDSPGGIRDLSVGSQYLRLQDSDFDGTVGVTFLNTPITFPLKIEPTINAVMFNAAYRYNKNEDNWFHPYIGGGIGAAFVDVDFSAAGTVTVGGMPFITGAVSGSESAVGFAWQALAGVDVDVTDHVYAGVNYRYFGTDVTFTDVLGAPGVDVDVDFRQHVIMGVIGYRF